MLLSRSKRRRHVAGLTLIEVLIVLGILGVLVGIGAARFSPNAARAYSNDLQALFQQARFEAIKRNAPVAVIWDSAATTFRSVEGGANPCEGESVLGTADAARYPRITIDTTFEDGRGLVWLPSGQARSCELSAFAATIARVSDGRNERVLKVSLTGKVDIE